VVDWLVSCCGQVVDCYSIVNCVSHLSKLMLFNIQMTHYIMVITIILQLDAVVAKVKAHLDAKNDLASILSNIPCILPYLG
jgi:hypothetical protein